MALLLLMLRQICRMSLFVLGRGWIVPLWMEAYPYAKVFGLGPTTLDHLPLLLVADAFKRNFPKPFRFRCFWPHDDSFLQVVTKAWPSYVHGSPGIQFIYRLHQVKRELKVWNRPNFGFLEDHINSLISQLLSIYNPFSSSNLNLPNPSINIGCFLACKKVFVSKRLMMTMLSLGIMHVSFFIKPVGRGGLVLLIVLFWMESRWLGLTMWLIVLFLNLFIFLIPLRVFFWTYFLPRMRFERVNTVRDNDSLVALPSMEEIGGIVKSFRRWKAPGSDGFPTELNQSTWPII